MFTESSVLNDPSTSTWLKEAVKAIDSRDVVDYINDIKVLLDLLSHRLDATMPEV